MEIKKFFYYYQKARALPPYIFAGIVMRKILNQINIKLNKINAKIRGAEISDEEFLRHIGVKRIRANTVSDLVRHFKKRNHPTDFLNFSKREKAVKTLREHFPDTSEVIVKQAYSICEHIFDLLGSGPIKVHYGMKVKGFEGYYYNTQIKSKELATVHRSPFTIHNYEPIDWHIDFKSGYRWNPRTYYKDIKYGHRLGVDIKVPWELSRFQHLTTLGEAYCLSKNEKYAKEFVNQIADWIEHNSPKFGVNWTCTMDVAIRACNWLLAWEFFKGSPLISDEFIIKIFKSLLQHGRHIKNNLEYSEALTSNHYLSDIVGLVYLGVLVPEFKESKKWKNFGIEELKKEMGKQVYSDGVDFEASTCYHRLVLELFFYVTFLVIINDKNFKEDNFMEVGNEIFGEEYIQRLCKMFEFVLCALKPNGRMPQIGDNDNGRLHTFAKREVLDMRYLLTLGAIFFKEPKFKIKEFGFCEEALWIFGETGYKIWQNLEENCLENIGSKAFPDAGWYIMRSDKDYMIISCGPNGQNEKGGHCHNDKLSFELCIDRKDIIIDPGTYVYTSHSEWRSKFRSTVYHNTVVVDGKEQNRFDEKNLFRMGNEAKVKVNKWETSDKYDFLDAQHSGYELLSEPVTHHRQILFNKKEGYWMIKDFLIGKSKHAFDLYFHFAPMKIEVNKENPLVVHSNIKGGTNMVIVPMETEELKVFTKEGGRSYSYGEKVKATTVKYSKTAKAPIKFVSVICPHSSLKSLFTVKESFESFEGCRSK